MMVMYGMVRQHKAETIRTYKYIYGWENYDLFLFINYLFLLALNAWIYINTVVDIGILYA